VPTRKQHDLSLGVFRGNFKRLRKACQVGGERGEKAEGVDRLR